MTLLHQAAQKAVEALTTLVQEYAADCEAVALEKHCFPGDSWKNKQTVADATLARLRANLESALQQQPEPVGYVHPLLLRELQRGTSLSIPLVARSEADTDEGGDVPLYTAPPALQHQEEPSTAVIPPAPPECGTEDEKTAFSFGYWRGLHAARKGQEVPREPVTPERISMALAVALTELPRSRVTTAARHELRAFGRAFANALAASPSTTRQQEVNADADAEYHSWFPVYAGVRTDAQGQPWQRIEDADLAEMERWIENGGSRRAFFIPIDGDRLANFTLHMIREVRATRQQEVGSGPDWKAYALHYEKALRHIAETAFASKDWKYAREALAAAPSTPEKAGGVSDGVGAHGEGQQP